jgi:anaerobic selenocysteine-containing dehydrogenase
MIRPATCPLCEASCGILVDVENGMPKSVRGDDEDPFSQGYICPKASALVDLHDDPDRLRVPMIREGSHWREASWDEALERAAEGIRRVRKDDRDAVAMYYGNPVAHNLGLLTHGLPFARALRTKNLYSASSTDQLPQMLVAYRMFGHLALMTVPDVDRTDFFLVMGANPLVSNGSIMTAPDMKRRLRAIQGRGGKVVVVDPRRTETAEAADEHVFIRPGTDALFLAAMLNIVFEEGLAKPSLDARNIDALKDLVKSLTPERAAKRTGVAPETTRRLAREFARTERAVCYGRVGLCTQRHGTLASWLAQALNLVTGHTDVVGGAMITTPAVDFVALLSRLRLRGSYDRWRSRVRKLPEFAGEFPVATLADEIETEGKGRVRALVTVAGNPVLSAPNGRRLDRAFASLEHVVSIDSYLNETTRHAHVILPPVPPLARVHYDIALYAFAVRNVAKLSDPIAERAASERHDWEIMAELGARVFSPKPLRAMAIAAAKASRPEHILDGLLRIGPHRTSVKALRAAPHGVDFGPLEPGRLTHCAKHVDCAPADLVDEARRELSREADRKDEGLVLVGRRQLRSNNSWMHNSHRLVKGPRRCTLLVHPDDARARGLSSGDLARLESDAGTVIVPVEVTDAMLRGVVSLPHGWGHDRDGIRLRVARENAGTSINDITSDAFLDTLTGTAGFNGLSIKLSRAHDEARVGGLDSE